MTVQSLIRDLMALVQEEPIIFASEEDAQYFRESLKNSPLEADRFSSRKGRQVPCRNLIDSSLDSALKSPDCAELPFKRNRSPAPEPMPTPKKAPPVYEKGLKAEELPTPALKEAVLPLEKSQPTPPPPASWTSAEKIGSEPPNFAAQKKLFEKLFPHIPILEEIPSDASAKKIAKRYKTKNQIAKISILLLGEPPMQKALLAEIAKAVDIYFGPARLVNAEAIEKEKQWETFLSSADLKYVIACDFTLWQLSDLLRYYKEVPASKTRVLGNTPLFLLPDLSLYLKDPLLKRSLWKSLCQKLSS